MATAQSDLQALVNEPREDLALEVKGWLDLSARDHVCLLAKAIVAIANHGGGHIVIGFDELGDGTFLSAPVAPATLDGFSQDAVNGIVKSYADPSFQVTVSHVSRAKDGQRFPVISVPGQHRTPILARRGSPDQKTLVVGHVYVRRPGPESAEPANANEWRELLDRCIRAGRDDLLDAIRGVLAPPSPEVPTRDETEELRSWRDVGLSRWSDVRKLKE